MMGQRRFDTKLYYNLSLDRLVPQDHLLRQIAAAVDSTLIRAAASMDSLTRRLRAGLLCPKPL